jgi:antirestriction protein ArdC
MLAVAARLPSYSPHNLLLIASQRPDATRIAGYSTWRQLGRQVRKGERGIAILAPVSYRVSDGGDRTATEKAAARPADPGDGEVRRVLRGFRVAFVFDVAQTDGPPLPELRPQLLDGQAPPGLWSALARQIGDAGFRLVRGDCAPANGVTDRVTRMVTVREDLPDAQAVKTLAHELAHVMLHGADAPASMTRERAEVEAESVAYLVTTAHGLDAADYTVPYVTGWSGGQVGLVLDTAERVLSTAGGILAAAPTLATGAIKPPERETRVAARRRTLAVTQAQSVRRPALDRVRER